MDKIIVTSKTEKETNNSGDSHNSSSSSTNTPKPAPNPYPNGLVSISSSVTPNQSGEKLDANEYACGSSITLTANYTYPTDSNVNVNHNGTLYFE